MERKNWAENITINHESLITPVSAAEVVVAIQTAERDGKQVRAIGSGCSYTDVSYSNHVLMDMSRMNRLLAFSQGRITFRDRSPVLTDALRDDVLSSTRRLAHVQSGITIKELYRALDKRDAHPGDSERNRWALFTQGGAGGQTLAGAISTGTHGSDFNLPPISDWVRAIHMIGPGGVHHWIEITGTFGLTDRSRLQRAMPELRAENIHYDDDWFNAVLVSMGSMGVMISLVVEVDKQFGLSLKVLSTNWRRLRPFLEGPAIFERDPATRLDIRHPETAAGRPVTASPRGFEIFLNPYRISDNYSSDTTPDRHCYFVSRFTANASDFRESPFDEAPTGGGDHFCNFWRSIGGSLRDAWTIIRIERDGPGTVKDEINGIMERSRRDTTGYPVGYSVMDTYDYGGAKPPVMSMEIAISTANNRHTALIDRLLETFDIFIRNGGDRKLIGAMSLRFTMPSRAFLAMQNQGSAIGRDRICHIEIFGLMEVNAAGGITRDGNMEGHTDAFLLAFEEAVHAFGGRLHWGQINIFDRCRIEQAYPDTLHRWRNIRTQMVSTGKSNTFSNWFTKRCGLEAYNEVLAATSWGPNRYDIFKFNERGEVLQLWWSGAWTWSNLGNRFRDGERFFGPLTAASWGDNRIDVFGMGRRGNVLQLTWAGGWTWTNLGNGFSDGKPFAGPISAMSSSDGKYDIFGLDHDGNIRRLWFDRGWHWSNLGNRFVRESRLAGSPAATSWGPGRVDVFMVGRAGNVLQLWSDTTRTGSWNWSDLGNGFPGGDRFCGPISATSSAPNRIEIFGVGKAGNVLELWWGDGSWHWDNLGNGFPNEVSKRLGPPRSFGAAPGEPYQMWMRERERDRFTGPISAASWNEHRIDIFGLGESGNIMQLFFDRGWRWANLGNVWGS